MRNTGPSPQIRDQVKERDGNACRRCRRAPATQIHHRAPRAAGGSKNCDWINNPANLVLVDDQCHAYIESHRARAYETGWLIRRTSDDLPEEVPLTDVYGARFVLDDEGGITYITKGTP